MSNNQVPMASLIYAAAFAGQSLICREWERGNGSWSHGPCPDRPYVAAIEAVEDYQSTNKWEDVIPPEFADPEES